MIDPLDCRLVWRLGSEEVGVRARCRPAGGVPPAGDPTPTGEVFAGGSPHGGKPVHTEEKRNELELKRIEADTVKLPKEAKRMDLSHTLDKMRLVVTAIAAGAAALVALDTIGLMGGAARRA